jgi:hypothetical protein
MFDDEHIKAKGYEFVEQEQMKHVQAITEFLVRKGVVRSVFSEGEVKYIMNDEHRHHECVEVGCYSEDEFLSDFRDRS